MLTKEEKEAYLFYKNLGEDEFLGLPVEDLDEYDELEAKFNETKTPEELDILAKHEDYKSRPKPKEWDDVDYEERSSMLKDKMASIGDERSLEDIANLVAYFPESAEAYYTGKGSNAVAGAKDVMSLLGRGAASVGEIWDTAFGDEDETLSNLPDRMQESLSLRDDDEGVGIMGSILRDEYNIPAALVGGALAKGAGAVGSKVASKIPSVLSKASKSPVASKVGRESLRNAVEGLGDEAFRQVSEDERSALGLGAAAVIPSILPALGQGIKKISKGKFKKNLFPSGADKVDGFSERADEAYDALGEDVSKYGPIGRDYKYEKTLNRLRSEKGDVDDVVGKVLQGMDDVSFYDQLSPRTKLIVEGGDADEIGRAVIGELGEDALYRVGDEDVSRGVADLVNDLILDTKANRWEGNLTAKEFDEGVAGIYENVDQYLRGKRYGDATVEDILEVAKRKGDGLQLSDGTDFVSTPASLRNVEKSMAQSKDPIVKMMLDAVVTPSREKSVSNALSNYKGKDLEDLIDQRKYLDMTKETIASMKPAKESPSIVKSTIADLLPESGRQERVIGNILDNPATQSPMTRLLARELARKVVPDKYGFYPTMKAANESQYEKNKEE